MSTWPTPTTERVQWHDPTWHRGSKHRGPYTYDAFIPPEIADAELQLGRALRSEIADAEAAVRGYGQRSDIPHAAVIAPLLRTEAVASSGIERLDISERRLAEALSNIGRPNPSAVEVANNVRALEQALAFADEPERIDTRFLVGLQETLLRETDDAGIAGHLRTEVSWIGGQSPVAADYVPPPPERVAHLLDDLAEYIERRDQPTLVRAAISHAQFEGIHPFGDGDGRTGRALTQVILRRDGLTPKYALPVSAALLTDTPGYFEDLRSYQIEGAPEPIIRRFTHSAATAATHAQRLLDDLAMHQDRWAEALAGVRSDAFAKRLIADLPRYPVLDARTVADRHAIDPNVARRAFDVLTEQGILRTAGGQRNRVWICEDVISAQRDFADSLPRTRPR